MALLNSKVHTSIEGVAPDVNGWWSNPKYGSEQMELLELAEKWQNSRKGRVVTFLAGDIHLGGFTDIVSPQVITSRAYICILEHARSPSLVVTFACAGNRAQANYIECYLQQSLQEHCVYGL